MLVNTGATACDILLDNSWLDAIMHTYPSVFAIFGWVLEMLSYQQNIKHKTGFGILSQVLAVICMVALVVFGFTRGSWVNFLIVPALAWLQIQFIRRLRARPGTWW